MKQFFRLLLWLLKPIQTNEDGAVSLKADLIIGAIALPILIVHLSYG